MRRAVVIAVAVAVSTVARASWQVLSVPGTPADVEIGDAGVPEWFAIATDQGSYGFVGDAGAGTVAGASIGVVLDRAKSCFGSVVQSKCAISWNGACNAGTGPPPATFSNTCSRVRALSGGGAFLASIGSVGNNLEYSPTGGAASDWNATATPLISGGPVATGALHVPGKDFAVLLGTAVVTKLFPCDNSLNCGATLPEATLSLPAEVEVVGSAQPGQVLVGLPNGVLASVPLDGGALTLISLPGAIDDIGALAVEQGTGDSFGDGFGMLAVHVDGGGFGVLSAVPDPGHPAETWLPSTQPPPAFRIDAGFRHMRCLSGRVCVVLTDAVNTQNVLVYHNDFPPDAGLPALIPIVPNAVTPYAFDAGDDDGDAVFVTWQGPDGGYPFGFAVSDNRGLAISIDAGAGLACGSASQNYDFHVVASDGYAPHDQASTVRFVLSSAGGSSPPLVSPDGGLLVLYAGSSPVTVTFSIPDGGCAASSFTVSPLTGPNGVRVTPGTTSASVSVPADRCSPDAGVDTFTVSPVGSGVDAGAPLEVVVLPWGLPLEPFDGGNQTLTQVAGTTVRYSRDQTHVCDVNGSGFPGVDTFWSWQALPPGDTVVGDGGASAWPLESPFVDVTLSCQASGSPVSLLAYNQTVDGSGGLSNTDVFTIQQSFAFPSLGAIGLNYQVVAPLIPVTVSLTPPPPCAVERGLYATATLDDLDGGFVAQGSGGLDAGGFAVIDLGYPGGCTGGQFLLLGQIFLDGGSPGPGSSTPITTPALNAELDTTTFVSPTAQCGGPAINGSITAVPAPQDGGICTQLTWSWAQSVTDGGPHVANLAVNSPTLPLQTVETGFGLIGDVLHLTVSAQGRPGDVVSLPRDVTIAAPLFVSVSHQTDTVRPEEATAFGVAVTLLNTSDCDVTNVDFQEITINMIPAAQTARVAGVPVTASSDGATLQFSGLSLPAHTPLTLSYSARPKLLAQPAPHGIASIQGVPISQDSGLAPTPSGCGCSGGSGSATLPLLALILASARLRRLRRGLAAARPVK